MERKETIKCAVRLFTLLMRQTADDTFRFPAGGVAATSMQRWFDSMTQVYGVVSRERLVDFCICQVFAIYGFDGDYIRRWKVSHSFGDKAMDRYSTSRPQRRLAEQRWLNLNNLSRELLLTHIEDRSKHPLYRFIDPQWEEATKRRMLSTEMGYYICGSSTLLWNPFSGACGKCCYVDKCRERTGKLYGELYRIRIAEYQQREVRR